jgi:hypothetical protein
MMVRSVQRGKRDQIIRIVILIFLFCWLAGGPALLSAEEGKKYYNYNKNPFNPANKYDPDNPYAPQNRFDPNSPLDPTKKYDSENPLNPAEKFNLGNPLNPANKYDPLKPL